MTQFIFVTGNQQKADYLAKWLGHPVEHRKLDLEELQSLDLREVAEHKARAAYAQVQKPVLVEDVALTAHALGRLPGTLIRWFLEEVQPAGIARMLDGFADRSAEASIMYALYDGKTMHFFEGNVQGEISKESRTSEVTGWKSGLSWNSIFIPQGHNKTYAEMSDEELRPVSHRGQAIAKLRAFLEAE